MLPGRAVLAFHTSGYRFKSLLIPYNLGSTFAPLLSAFDSQLPLHELVLADLAAVLVRSLIKILAKEY